MTHISSSSCLVFRRGLAGYVNDRKSISSSIQLVYGLILEWNWYKQTEVLIFSAQAEFESAAAIRNEIWGIKDLIIEISMQIKKPIVLRIDSKAKIQQIENEAASYDRNRTNIKLTFLRDYLARGR